MLLKNTHEIYYFFCNFFINSKSFMGLQKIISNILLIIYIHTHTVCTM